jgi:hypothetical protein
MATSFAQSAQRARAFLITMGCTIGVCGLSACASTGMKGQWRYEDANAIIGLNIKNKDSCELSMSRFMAEPLKKDCRFSTNKQAVAPEGKAAYLIFLKDANGQCDVFADFEFVHDNAAQSLTLLVGDTPFEMKK